MHCIQVNYTQTATSRRSMYNTLTVNIQIFVCYDVLKYHKLQHCSLSAFKFLLITFTSVELLCILNFTAVLFVKFNMKIQLKIALSFFRFAPVGQTLIA